jgi:hypothetical protein
VKNGNINKRKRILDTLIKDNSPELDSHNINLWAGLAKSQTSSKKVVSRLSKLTSIYKSTSPVFK